MATFQDHFLADQIISNLSRMPSNMRDNANEYKLNRKNLSALELASEIDGDMAQFLRRIEWMESLVTRNITALTDALSLKGLTPAQANTLKNTLKNAAVALRDAGKTSQDAINTACDAFLSSVPNYERIY